MIHKYAEPVCSFHADRQVGRVCARGCVRVCSRVCLCVHVRLHAAAVSEPNVVVF